jgi:ABC-type transporter Mla maintaining outer membrane lipid asymmetry ATPase subunit MlaF
MYSSFDLCHSFVLRHSSFVIAFMSPESSIIEVNHLVRTFGDRAVLDDISFNVHRGDTLVIMGGSGCGKSTLLRHMIGSMTPTSGSVKLFGEGITGMKEREIERIRLRFGMLFQSGALLASLTVGENVALPLLQHTKKSPDERRNEETGGTRACAGSRSGVVIQR